MSDLAQKITQVYSAGFVFLVIVFFNMNKNLCTTENFAENEVNDEIKKSDGKWHEFYQRPLIVPIRRKEKKNEDR